MPWFDSQNVIFVPNKWDTIKCNAMGSDENSSDEAQFDKLRTAKESMIKKNEEKRVIRHFRYFRKYCILLDTLKVICNHVYTDWP